ncbi:YqkE family protein [Bacillus sp. AGMB 02131]|uniref:YqkE family protein n=1 Tax=Peribacillus faecalis TaxID=2772559 RepID=A0A927CXQ9_9BACI|nr:YqkE family protein [Peribacillus faecalis]MBD3109588.1 YqkE family protein [Peribacillus faecalis]
MKKRKPQQKQKSVKQEESLTLSHMLNPDLVNQLKNKQKELEQQQQKQKELEEKQRAEARRKAEKNKSFAELLSEDTKDWRNFK